jgi:hypothetical protein
MGIGDQSLTKMPEKSPFHTPWCSDLAHFIGVACRQSCRSQFGSGRADPRGVNAGPQSVYREAPANPTVRTEKRPLDLRSIARSRLGEDRLATYLAPSCASMASLLASCISQSRLTATPTWARARSPAHENLSRSRWRPAAPAWPRSIRLQCISTSSRAASRNRASPRRSRGRGPTRLRMRTCARSRRPTWRPYTAGARTTDSAFTGSGALPT